MKAFICPVILHDKTIFYNSRTVSKRDKSLSVLIAILVHVAAFAVAGACFATMPQAGVDKGLGGIEVNLVAAPVQPVVPVTPIVPVPVKFEFAEKVVVKPVVVKKIPAPVVSKTQGKDKVTVHSTGGAITQAKPDYLNNPAPEYPELARRRGYEGVVLLKADIDAQGFPVKVDIEKSSGHFLLDESALKAWRSNPWCWCR
jgi:protein TonB